MEAYKINWPSSPPLMVPSITAWAPSQRTKTIAPKTSRIAIIVKSDRARIRRIAVSKAFSTELEKRFASMCSWVKACTVGMALRISPAMAEASAILSCESRESLRTRRPKSTIGKTTSAKRTMIMALNLMLVTKSMTRPPINNNAFLNAIEILVPTTVCISVVSAVRRESTSPVCVVSKNCGL